jgi:hypothetical protein
MTSKHYPKIHEFSKVFNTETGYLYTAYNDYDQVNNSLVYMKPNNMRHGCNTRVDASANNHEYIDKSGTFRILPSTLSIDIKEFIIGPTITRVRYLINNKTRRVFVHKHYHADMR